MIDKTFKRSFFARIACGIFAVVLAFCAVSVALYKPVEKADAYVNYSDGFVSDYIHFDSSILYSVGFTFNSSTVSIRNAFNTGSFSSSLVDGSIQYRDPHSYYVYVSSSSGTVNFQYGSASIQNFVVDSTAITSVDFAIDGDYGVLRYYFGEEYISLKFTNSYGYSSLSDFNIISYPTEQQTVTESVTDVWSSIFNWLTTSVNSLLSILYVNGELTILGVLVVMSLGISIFFLLLAVVSNFFHLRN